MSPTGSSRATARPLNAPERIGRELTRAILRGEFPPRTHLPTVRELAEEYGVNPATMQRAISRLEANGLVTARHGSGLLVNDPDVVGGVSLIPDWLDAMAGDPERAAAILEELLEVRRLLAVRLVTRHRAELLQASDLIGAEIQSMLKESSTASADDVWRLHFEVVRKLILVTGNSIVVALINSLYRALEQLPVLATAMYGDPARNIATSLEVIDAIRDGGDELGVRVEAALALLDAQSVTNYRQLLARER